MYQPPNTNQFPSQSTGYLPPDYQQPSYPNQQYPQQPPFSPQQPMYQPPFPPPPKKAWYTSNVAIILLLIFFFPVGLFLMWKYATWPKVAKIILTAFLAILVLVSAANNGGSRTATTDPTVSQQSDQVDAPTATPAPTPTPTPTPVPKVWTTTHTYTGNGIKKTETFTVDDHWKLQWSCDPTSFYGSDYNVIVSVYASDQTPLDYAAVNTLCKNGNASGETEERGGGSIYLDINSEAAWNITVQELR